jgi:SM-20-related protein
MPHAIRLNNFLGAEVCSELLQFAIASEGEFHPTAVGGIVEPDPNIRRSVCIDSMGRFVDVVEQRIHQVIPDLTHDLCLSRFETGLIDLQMVSHGDGGFYARHIDTFTGKDRFAKGDRVISCVYYFFSEPKAFTGGELRLHPLRTKAHPMPEAIDMQITNDTLIAFSSWLPHEVMTVSSPSRLFADSRFSINCWVHQAAHAQP